MEIRSGAVAAMSAGSAGSEMRAASDAATAMSSILSGMSARKRSMAQSETVQSLAVLLHVSLMRCCPSFAEEC